MWDQKKKKQLEVIIDHLADESITQEENILLDHFLVEYEDARLHYVAYMNMCAKLYSRNSEFSTATFHRSKNCDSLQQNSSPSFSIRQWQFLAINLITSAIIVALGIWCFQKIVFTPEVQQTIQLSPPLPILTQAVNVQWVEQTDDVQIGKPLINGRLRLHAGSISIRLPNTTSLILQGPADLQLTQDGQVFLRHGTMLMISSEKQLPITVTTSRFIVISDVASELGIRVDRQGAGEVHVFKGRADVQVNNSLTNLIEDYEVHAKQAVGFRETNQVERKIADSEQFLWPTEIESLAKVEQERRYRRWKAYSDTLAKDKDVVAYYRFEKKFENSDKLLNAKQGNSSMIGRVIGPSWQPGRWDQKTALSFAKRDDRVFVDANFTSKQLTLAAWINVKGIGHVCNSLLHTDGWQTHGQCHWTILSSGKIEFAIFKNRIASHKETDILFHSKKSLLDHLNQWVHLAVVYDSEKHENKIYINGQLDQTLQQKVTPSIVMGNLQIGNWNQQVRNFIGLIDELMIAQRVFTDAEIQQMYVAGNPYQ